MSKRKTKKNKNFKSFLFILFLLIVAAVFIYTSTNYEVQQKDFEASSSAATTAETQTERPVAAPVSVAPVSAADISFDYEENNPLYFGNPSKATSEPDDEANHLMEKAQYTLSYNNINLGPNWVAWHLSSSDLGDSGRSDKFIADKSLPKDWYSVKQSDYQFASYGFDRGHVCPSADRTVSEEDNQATFYMTNMLPQAPDCNRIVWKDLESYERQQALDGNELYIFAGGVGQGGTGNRGYFEEILLKNGQTILVPEYCWKILIILPEGDNDFERMATEAEIVSVCVPNQQGCQNNGSWDQYKCSISYIEEITHLDFLDLLPDDLEKLLED